MAIISWRRRDILASGLALAASKVRLAKAAMPTHILDSHVHIWRGSGKPSATHQQEPFSKEQLLQAMDAAGVERAIVITPSWNTDKNLYPIEAARSAPTRLAVMGLFDIAQKPDTQLIDNWKTSGMLGIRLFLASPAGRAWMTDGSADWFWPALERNNIPVMIFASGMMPAIGAIAERHPDLKICIDSFGVPPGVNGLAAFADYDNVLALSKYPNVGLKAESVPFLSGEAYPYTNLHPILHRTFDAFGPQSMFWGSDITLLKTIPYTDAIRVFTEELPWLKGRDLELVMGEALAAWVGWPITA